VRAARVRANSPATSVRGRPDGAERAEVVAGDDRDEVVAGIDAIDVTAHFGLVHDVVVVERGEVHQFEGDAPSRSSVVATRALVVARRIERTIASTQTYLAQSKVALASLPSAKLRDAFVSLIESLLEDLPTY